jgi:hypothetical protein
MFSPKALPQGYERFFASLGSPGRNRLPRTRFFTKKYRTVIASQGNRLTQSAIAESRLSPWLPARRRL